MKEREAWLLLGEAVVRFGLDALALAEEQGGAVAAAVVPAERLAMAAGVSLARAAAYVQWRDRADPGALLARLAPLGMGFLCPADEAFPESLRTIHQPPVGLYFAGRLEALERPCVAVVGARKASGYGLAVGKRLAEGLARSGVCVVSGMAHGVDAAAHTGALAAAGGVTAAVLGCGADVCYPANHRGLMERIRASGCVLSEFAPGTPPLRHHFPMRNRLVSGLSLGVVVVEASTASGSLITASLALEQGRDLFAVPGDIDRPLSAGPNGLLRQGAIPATCTADILEPLGLAMATEPRQGVLLAPEEQWVLELLEARGVHADWLAEQAAARVGGPAALSLALAGLVTKGLAKRLPGNRYSRG
jgi:DNA processing protein